MAYRLSVDWPLVQKDEAVSVLGPGSLDDVDDYEVAADNTR